MPARVQVGVVPILEAKGSPAQIVLITAKDKQRWLLPKGNHEPGLSRRQAALAEAFEEAGAIGGIDGNRFVDVPFNKGGELVRLRLYRMRVQRLMDDWPQRHERDRVLVRFGRAQRLLCCDSLRAGLEYLI